MRRKFCGNFLVSYFGIKLLNVGRGGGGVVELCQIYCNLSVDHDSLSKS